MDDEQGPQLGQLLHDPVQHVRLQGRELVDARGGQEALEPEHPVLVQRAQVRDVAGDGSTPEPHVHEALAARGGAFHLERLAGGGGGKGVQRHVDDRRDTTGCRCSGRRGETLPLGAPRLVDVHVRVDEAGQEDLVVGQAHDLASEVVADRGDQPVLDGDVTDLLAVGQQRSTPEDPHSRTTVASMRP